MLICNSKAVIKSTLFPSLYKVYDKNYQESTDHNAKLGTDFISISLKLLLLRY